MAAIRPQSSRQNSHPHSRLRSSSDPFVDPAARSKLPPPPPPKTKISSRMSATAAKTAAPARDPPRDITDAVRDTVTGRGTTDPTPRTRTGRSQTVINTSPNSNSRPTGQRSQSEDPAVVVEKPKASGKSRPKKGSQHADVIDRLDFTGVGPMFHHDGPFDACAPSRNRQRNKAPMFAWGAPSDAIASSESAYPSADAYRAFSSNYVEQPKKKVDPVAEAWGIHEPEPYEEFFAGGGSARPDGDTPTSSIYNGKDSHHSHSTSRSGTGPRRARDGRDPRDVYREYLEEGNNNGTRVRRSLVPPPKPIFVPEPTESAEPAGGSSPAGSPSFPKRSRSLMQRIRKMRDAPNVPVGSDYDQPPSPSSPSENVNSSTGGNSARPTHRHQQSFLGRLGGGTRPNQAASEKPEPFVYIDAHNKDLPLPPRPFSGSGRTDAPAENTNPAGYFEGSSGAAGPASPGLGRKTSIMRKVGMVVRGAK